MFPPFLLPSPCQCINNVTFILKESFQPERGGMAVYVYIGGGHGRVTIVNCTGRCTVQTVQEDSVEKERYADRIGKMCRAMVTVINHPRSYSGDPFRFLLAKRRSSGIPEKGVVGGIRGLGMVKILSRGRVAVLRTQQNITRFR